MARLLPVAKIDRMAGNEASSSETDEDSLSHVQRASRDRGSHRLARDLASASEDTDESGDGADITTKVEWSGDEDEQGAYEKFKNRHTVKRKRAAANRTRTRATKKVSTTGVGKRVSTKKAVIEEKPAKRPIHTYGDSTDDDEAMDEELPDYFRRRKGKFEASVHKPNHAGLRLAPTYDDVAFSDDERLESLQERPDFPLAKPNAPYKDRQLRYSLGVIPAPIAQWLREYQVHGAEFLHELFVYQKGGILGDDMGLGKTIQVIAFLTAAFGKTGDERDAKRMRKMRRDPSKPWYPRVLLICPGSLMANWQVEFRRWGFWQTDVFHGSTSIKDSVLQAATGGRLEVMITTYDTYRLNKSAINMIEWDCVVADECHKIKERKSEITQAMNEINALCRIGLTGTAIQNKYEELWTLLNWTNPGRFGPLRSWKDHISAPLRTGQSHDATVPELALARKTAKKLVENLLPQFFLRRTKALLKDQLPKKSDRVVFCPLTLTQAEAYEHFIDSEIVQTISTASDPCCNGKKRGWCCYTHVTFNGESLPWQAFVFPAIMTLQKLSNHIAMIIPSALDSRDKQAKDLAFLQIIEPNNWRSHYEKRDSILNYANQEFCGKWKVLKKLLSFWHDAGDKVLIFSHSVRLLKMLQTLFNSTTSYNLSFLDGSMAYDDRQKTVDDFNADPEQFVFLISTKAGGVGLNITSANKVVIVDPNWNPSWDQQAQDRAYRIGQLRDVEVFRLVSAGTIEEIVYARQIYKQQQANIGYNASNERRYFAGVQENKDKKGEIFGLVNLFAYHGDNVVLRDIVNKTNVAESRAGINVVGLDMSSTQDDWADDMELGGGEDDAMKQLAALVEQGDPDGAADIAKEKKERSARKDAVHAILASVGVEYTHENSEVIGTSKIETSLSKRAEEASDYPETREERVFAEALSQLDDGDLDRGDMEEEYDALHDAEEVKVAYRYHPPEDVRRRQFCSIAKQFGLASPTDFALHVESLTQAQRSALLDKFYKSLREKASDALIERSF